MRKTTQALGKALSMVVNVEIDALMMSAPSPTPAGLLSQAIDELMMIGPDDPAVGRKAAIQKQPRPP